jgi:diguanylate cyclase (GGDEF)-like protein
LLRLFLTTVLIVMTALPTWSRGGEAVDLRAELDRVRAMTLTASWQDVQAELEELAPLIEQAEVREWADYQLLLARNLTLTDRSRESLQLLDEILDRDIDDDQRLRGLQLAANVAVLLRAYEQAFEYLLAALELEAGLEGPPPELRTYGLAAYMFGRVGELDRAIGYGRMAVERARDFGTQSDECIARQRLAPVYKWAERFSEAEAEYRRAMAVCRAEDNELFVGVVKHGLADLLHQAGRLEEALELSEQSIELLEPSGFSLGEYEARLVRAEILHELGDVRDNEQELIDIAEYQRERELWDQLARLEMLLSERAALRDEPEVALEHMRAHLEARERFLSRDRAMRLAYLEVQFDTRLKEQEIELLRESARAAELEAVAVDQRRQIRTITLVLAGLLLLLVTLLLVRTIRERRHFRRLSQHDALTGLANHTWFFHQAESLLQRARRHSQTMFLVLADVDHFKQINDRHGHPVGDQVLCETAAAFRKAFGERAVIGRLGGEEFGVAVIAGSLEPVAERVSQVRATGQDQLETPVTLSFGIAQAGRDDDMISLRKRADQALYQAKAEGRDRVVAAEA